MACGWRWTARKPVIVSICCGGTIKVGMVGVQLSRVENKTKRLKALGNPKYKKFKDDDDASIGRVTDGIYQYVYINICVCIYRNRREKRPWKGKRTE
jgi:hypothetical protein